MKLKRRTGKRFSKEVRCVESAGNVCGKDILALDEVPDKEVSHLDMLRSFRNSGGIFAKSDGSGVINEERSRQM